MPDKRYIVAGVPETGEEYLCELIDESTHGHKPKPHPIVLVLCLLRYPRQRAITDPDIATEIPPIQAGTFCRMKALRETDKSLPFFSQKTEKEKEAWAKAQFRAALEEALRTARNDQERDILLGQKNGTIKERISVLTFPPWEIAALIRNREQETESCNT